MKILVSLLLLSAALPGQTKPTAQCEVIPSWSTTQGPRSAKLPAIASFDFSMDDIHPDFIVRSFHDSDPDVSITTALDIARDYSTPHLKPIRVALAITVETDKEKPAPRQIFETPEASSAEVEYRKGWNLRVSKSIVIPGDRTYTYTVHCWQPKQ